MRRCAAALGAGLLLAGLLGCGGPRGFGAVRPGMATFQVQRIAGKPLRKEVGDYARAGRDVWYYPEGEVHFYMNAVTKVRRRGEGEPERRPWERERSPWELRP